jgi:hypothetical protein
VSVHPVLSVHHSASAHPLASDQPQASVVVDSLQDFQSPAVGRHNRARSPNGNTRLLGAVATCRPGSMVAAAVHILHHFVVLVAGGFELELGHHIPVFSAECVGFDMPWLLLREAGPKNSWTAQAQLNDDGEQLPVSKCVVVH